MPIALPDSANILAEAAEWEAGLYQIETDDPVLGGPTGIANLHARQLANRTVYLKELMEIISDGLAAHEAGNNHPMATLAAKGMVVLASAAEAIAGNDAAKTVTPAALSAVVALLAPKSSPALTGTPTAPTAADGTNTTQLATTAFVQAAVTALINGSPGMLDTLNELATALGNDANFATTITAALAAKAPLDSPALAGTPTAPTAAPGTSTAQLATTAFVAAALSSLSVKQKSLIATAQTFAPGVADGDPVRWDAGNSRWAKALADGTANDLGLGLADVTNAEVVLYGETRAGLVAGLTPGARYHLGLAGGLSAAAAPADPVKIGVAKTATVLWVDIDAMAAGTVVATLTDAATIAWDPATQPTAKVTLATTRTLGAPVTVIEGDYYTLLVAHGAAGSYLSYNPAYKGVSGITLSAGNGAVDHLTFRGGPGGIMYLTGWRLGVGA